MKFRFSLGATVCLTLAVMMVESDSLDNEHSKDINTKLAVLTEQMAKISGELIKQSGQLSKLTQQQTKLSEQQSQTAGQVSKLTIQLTELTDQKTHTADDVTKIDVVSQIKGLEQKMHASSSGPVFVRWGRNTCNGTSSETVYTGVAGGSPGADAGGGADLLCLPRDPSYANHDEVQQQGNSHLVVAEYKIESSTNFPFEHNDPLLRDEDVPCAVCQVTNGSSVMMIPARVDCYSGWKLEYRGYLMAEEINAPRIHYVCVDANPEVDYGGGGSVQYSVRFYIVETACNYLPCPPFEEWAETACVVCSK